MDVGDDIFRSLVVEFGDLWVAEFAEQMNVLKR